MTKPTRAEPSGDLLNTCFSAIEKAAIEGARCPENGTFGVNSYLTSILAGLGRIRVLIFTHNFRQVEILTGPHAGKRTARPPKSTSKPYKIIDATGTRHRTRMQHQQPSPPQPLRRLA